MSLTFSHDFAPRLWTLWRPESMETRLDQRDSKRGGQRTLLIPMFQTQVVKAFKAKEKKGILPNQQIALYMCQQKLYRAGKHAMRFLYCGIKKLLAKNTAFSKATLQVRVRDRFQERQESRECVIIRSVLQKLPKKDLPIEKRQPLTRERKIFQVQKRTGKSNHTNTLILKT